MQEDAALIRPHAEDVSFSDRFKGLRRTDHVAGRRSQGGIGPGVLLHEISAGGVDPDRVAGITVREGQHLCRGAVRQLRLGDLDRTCRIIGANRRRYIR